METALLVSIFVVAAILAWMTANILFWPSYVALHNSKCWFNNLTANTRERAFVGFRDDAKERRRAEFRRWFESRHGSDETTGAIDDTILQAKQQAPVLRRIVQEELPDTIRRCVSVHRISALAAGAEYIYEIALQPETFGLRERVIYLAETSVELLSRYPFLLDDPGLIHNLVVLRSRILPTCRNCPYLDFPLSEAPLLCPSAEIAGVGRKESEAHERQQ